MNLKTILKKGSSHINYKIIKTMQESNKHSSQYSASSAKPSELRDMHSCSCSPTSRRNFDDPFISSSCPYPINFKQTSSWNLGEGRIRFYYTWESSSGNLDDLGRCIMEENVDYIGGNPFVPANPPFDGWSLPNPTNLRVDPTLGWAYDTHEHGDFVKPYRSVGFTATQVYRYRTNCMPSSSYIIQMGPHNIDRSVYQVGDQWIYKIEKNGVASRLDLSSLSRIKTFGDIDDALAVIQTIKTGSTRAELLQYFVPVGGFTNRTEESYWYRGYGKLLIDVEFEPAEPGIPFNPLDRIIKLSKPYLASSSVLD